MQKKTKKTLFVRPNLKLFVLAALGLVVVQHFISSSAGDIILTNQIHTSPPRDQEIERLLDQTMLAPSHENFSVLSDIYRMRGETDKAMHYLRKAVILSDIEGTD